MTEALTASKFLPLREPTFYILLSLAEGEKHGYAIIKDVGFLSQGKVRLSTGTLYEGLARMLEQGLIERVPDVNGENQVTQSHPGKPRKAYQLTGLGKQVLKAETYRLRTLISAAYQCLSHQSA
jgi:DNA-binding PadR family transcriptional regulator